MSLVFSGSVTTEEKLVGKRDSPRFVIAVCRTKEGQFQAYENERSIFASHFLAHLLRALASAQSRVPKPARRLRWAEHRGGPGFPL